MFVVLYCSPYFTWFGVKLSWRNGPSTDMMTSSNGNIFRVTGPLCEEFTGPGEFPTQMPVTRSFDVLLDLRLNKRLSKQPWGWWFETPSWSLWRQRNGFWVAKVHPTLTRISVSIFYMLRYDVDDMPMSYWTLLGTVTDLPSNDDAV